MEERIAGIVLKASSYLENRRIATLFSKEKGVISVLIPRADRRLELASPFCEGEFVIKPGRADLFRLYDGSVLDPHFFLRSSLTDLRIAGELARAILKSQLPGKPAPKLYTLFSLSLKKIPESGPSIVPLFFLKLALHEGCISQGSRDSFPVAVTEDEWTVLKRIMSCRSFRDAASIPINETLQKKIKNTI